VERNQEIVDREAYGETRLFEGDVLELVRLVGGG
jgi:thiamine biosynthesis protein ThiS